ncbi:MAG: HIT family protein [Pseudomonadota bacterium]
MIDFSLDDRLAADSLPLCETPDSLLRVIRDARFPWLILVPRHPGLADLIDLAPEDEPAVMAVIRTASEALKAATGCDKLNVASLGNQVRQLHVHIIARFETDAAWPGPIWGVGKANPMDALPDWAVTVQRALVAKGWAAS